MFGIVQGWAASGQYQHGEKSGPVRSPLVAERVLTTRELNRALLARQLLLERVRLPIPRVLERIGGIQNQYAPNGYIRLWSSIDGFTDDLTRALERRSVIQGTLMRETIHLVSRRDYPLFAAGIRRSGQEWLLRVDKLTTNANWPPQRGSSPGTCGAGRSRGRSSTTSPAVVWGTGSTSSACLRAARGSTRRAHVRPGGGVGRPARGDRGATASSTWRVATSTPSARLPPKDSRLVEDPAEAAGAGARANAAPTLPRRGREGAPGCPPRTAPRPRDSRAGPVPADLGRNAARPRAPHAHPPGALPRADLPHEGAASFPTFLVDGQVAGTWRYENGRVKTRAVRDGFRAEPSAPRSSRTRPSASLELHA